MDIELKDAIIDANTGADAIQKAPIVDYNTGRKCLRIGDISNQRKYNEWGYTEVNEENYKKYKLEKEDILIARTGSTIGINTFIEKDYKSVYNNGLIRLRIDKSRYNSKFIYYVIQTNKFKNYINGIAFGTTGQPNMKINDLLKFKFHYISLEIQNKIVTILDNLDQKIELNSQINNNLYKIVSQLYQNLFDYGEWEEIELKDIANVFSGKRPKEKLDEGVYPIVGANGIVGFTSDYNLDNDIIITGRVGTLGIVKRHYRKVWASDNTLIIKTKYNNFVENYLKTVDYSSLNRGSTQPLLSQSDLKSQKMLFNKEIVESFELRVKKKIEKIRNNDEENEVLEKLRDTLLPKLMNGKIDLENIRI